MSIKLVGPFFFRPTRQVFGSYFLTIKITYITVPQNHGAGPLTQEQSEGIFCSSSEHGFSCWISQVLVDSPFFPPPSVYATLLKRFSH